MNTKHIIWLSLVLGICFLTQKAYCQGVDDTDYLADNEEEEEEEEDDTGPPPVITTPPLNLTVKPGEVVLLPCEIENLKPHHTVLWRNSSHGLFLGSIKQTLDERINKIENNTLEIRQVATYDSGSYTCQVPGFNVEVIHRIHVRSRAKIVQMSPVGPETILHKGDTLSLKCLASGYPEPRVVWSRNDNELRPYDPTVKVVTITIQDVTRKNAGIYKCTASNGPDMVDTKSVEVHVHYPPEIEIERDTVTTAEGYESELICNVHAVPKPKVIWLYNGVPIDHSKHLSITRDGSRHTLHIKDTKKTDFGQYTCFANNTQGTNKKNILLSGNPGQPKFDSSTVDNESHSPILVWKVESYSRITDYELLYKEETADDWKTVRQTYNSSSGNNIYTVKHKLTDLPPGSYQAKLRAKNDYGWSHVSESQVFSGEFEAADPSETGPLEAVKGEGIGIASELRISVILLFALLFAHFCC